MGNKVLPQLKAPCNLLWKVLQSTQMFKTHVNLSLGQIDFHARTRVSAQPAAPLQYIGIRMAPWLMPSIPLLHCTPAAFDTL